MEKEEIIKEINRMLNEIEHNSKIDFCSGLCLLTDIKFRKLMSKQAGKQGIESDTDLYWWHGRLVKEIMESSNWYAPRIKFLEDWKKELLDENICCV